MSIIDDGRIWAFVTEFPFWLEGLQALSKFTVEVPSVLLLNDPTKYKRNVKTIMRRIKESRSSRNNYPGNDREGHGCQSRLSEEDEKRTLGF
jgi:hypothetical protein